MVLKQHTIMEFGKEKPFDEAVNAFLATGKKITEIKHLVTGEGHNIQLFAFIIYEE